MKSHLSLGAEGRCRERVRESFPRPDSSLWASLVAAFCSILPDSERAESIELTEPERRPYRHRFWLARDPTPTTDENEFLEDVLARDWARTHL